MAILEPRLAILDETDSGLDIDALRIVANGINRLRSPERAVVLVTHYQRLLEYVVPDRVHVLSAGRIVKSGGKISPSSWKLGYECGWSPPWGGLALSSAASLAAADTGVFAALDRFELWRSPGIPGCGRSGKPHSHGSAAMVFPPRATRSGGTPTWRPSRAPRLRRVP
jgi:energy-coupling factor transporter ATP-binding protein EcfA2